MITIQLSNADEKRCGGKVSKFMADVVIRNPEFNGVDFQIVMGDYTYVDDPNGIRGAWLMSAVNRILEDAA